MSQKKQKVSYPTAILATAFDEAYLFDKYKNVSEIGDSKNFPFINEISPLFRFAAFFGLPFKLTDDPTWATLLLNFLEWEPNKSLGDNISTALFAVPLHLLEIAFRTLRNTAKLFTEVLPGIGMHACAAGAEFLQKDYPETAKNVQFLWALFGMLLFAGRSITSPFDGGLEFAHEFGKQFGNEGATFFPALSIACTFAFYIPLAVVFPPVLLIAAPVLATGPSKIVKFMKDNKLDLFEAFSNLFMRAVDVIEKPEAVVQLIKSNKTVLKSTANDKNDFSEWKVKKSDAVIPLNVLSQKESILSNANAEQKKTGTNSVAPTSSIKKGMK